MRKYLQKEIDDNSQLIKNIEENVQKIYDEFPKPISADEFFKQNRENEVIKCYLEEFRKIKVSNNVIRNLKRPYQYIEPLIEIKSAFMRHDPFFWKLQVLEGCKHFLYSNRIFLRDPTQLFPMIDLLDQICYYIDNSLFRSNCSMNISDWFSKKKLKADKELINYYSNGSSYDSYSLVSIVTSCLMSEIRNNFTSAKKASELIDYVIYLIGQEIQNQYLLNLFVDENYLNVSSDLESFIPTEINGISSKTSQKCNVSFPFSCVSIIAIPDNQRKSFLQWLTEPSYSDFLADAKIRYFPELKLCLVERGNHRVAKALIQKLSSNSSFVLESTQYDVSYLFQLLDLTEDNRKWVFLDSNGNEIEKRDVADIRVAALYKLAKLKHEIISTNKLIDHNEREKPFISNNISFVEDAIKHRLVDGEAEVNLALNCVLNDTQSDYDTIEKILDKLYGEKKLSKRFKVKCPHCGTSFLLPKEQNDLRLLPDVVQCFSCHKQFFCIYDLMVCYFSTE